MHIKIQEDLGGEMVSIIGQCEGSPEVGQTLEILCKDKNGKHFFTTGTISEVTSETH
jgi:hypothetical protein